MRVISVILAVIGLTFIIVQFSHYNNQTTADKIENTLEEAADEAGDTIESAADKINEMAR